MKTIDFNLRFALRLLSKDRGFTVLSLAALAVGIAVNTTVFTLIDAVALKPLPVKDPDQIVRIYRSLADGSSRDYAFSWQEYSSLRDQAKLFSGLIAEACCFRSILGPATAQEEGEIHVTVTARVVSSNYFSVLGIPAALGQMFSAQNDDQADQAVVVLSHGFWKRYYGSAADIVGKSIRVNGNLFTIVGVAPREFVGTASPPMVPDIWIPMKMHAAVVPGAHWMDDSKRRVLRIVGRLKPKAAPERAGTDLSLIAAQWPLSPSQKEKTLNVTVRAASFLDTGTGPEFSVTVMLVLGAVGIVLLIACADVSNMMLARATARQKEFGIRLALGAHRSHLIWQLLTESSVIAAIAGTLGLLLSMLMSSSIAVAIQGSMQALVGGSFILAVKPDAKILAYTIGLAALATILFGLAPALRASRSNLVSILQEEVFRTASPRRALRLRLDDLLVIGQVAVCIVLMVSAGLLIRGLVRSLSSSPGFDTRHLITAELDFTPLHYDETRLNLIQQQIADRLHVVGGVRSVAYAEHIPLLGAGYADITSDSKAGNVHSKVPYNVVSPEYLETVGIPIVRGRNFMAQDANAPGNVVIVSQSTAQRFWPGQDAIGQRIRTDRFPVDAEVIGVARDVSNVRLSQIDAYYLYFCTPAKPARSQTDLIIRSSADAQGVLREVDQALEAIDPKLVLASSGIHPMSDMLDLQITPRRIAAAFASLLGSIGLFFAIAGIYATTGYRVSRRTREIGIRMALGADRSSVLRLILRHSMLLVLIGIVLGASGALVVSPVLAGFLFNVGSFDPVSFLGVAVLFIAVAMCAALLPARNATAIDPIMALRTQ
jgi:putative ABC transport system permease protein